MSTVRIAVASTPLTAAIDDAVSAAIAAIDDAGRAGAAIVCLPEAGVPGHRVQARTVQDASQVELDGALADIAEAARRSRIVAIVGSERWATEGREIVAIVIDADGSVLGVQPKTQIDPTEEADYVPGSGRHVYEAAGLRFGITICHEGFRYPEIARSLALAGAQVVFAPHFVTTDDGSLPDRWGAATSPYNEKALMCRALENTVYVAAANIGGPDQGSITGIIGPDGSLVASLAYGTIGVIVADVDLAAADGTMARRWAPDRSVVSPDRPDTGP